MALKATIFKADLTVSDLDRGHFETHALTIARHPWIFWPVTDLFSFSGNNR